MTTDVRVQDELLERDAELSHLAAVLDATAGGSGRAALIEGVPGIGKTRLLLSARDEASRRSLRVVTARGAELESEFAFGVVLQLLEGIVRGSAPTQRQELFDGAAALAAPLFAGEPVATSPGADPSFSLIHGLYWLCQNLAEDAPLVLLVDDVHWADRPSLRFLLYLAQRLDELPIGLVATLRTSEADAPDELDRLRAHPAVSRLQPSALSADAVTGLVERALPDAAPAFAASCAELTRGNPFLLRELLTQLVADEIAPTADSAARLAGVAPTSIVRTLVVRLARLDRAAGELLRATAVLGDGAPAGRAATLADLDPRGPRHRARRCTTARLGDGVCDRELLPVRSRAARRTRPRGHR